MKVFTATINQMLILYLFMAVGYFLNKKNLLVKETSNVISKLEAYILVPCLVFSTFAKYSTVENFKAKSSYILYGFGVMAVSWGIGAFLARIFAKESYLRRIYTYSFAVANFSFMGYAVVAGVFGQEALFDYMMFALPINLYTYSFGIASLKPQKQGKLSFKMFLNPICISMALGIVCGLIKIPLPAFLTKAIDMAGATMSPLAMLLTGFVVGNFSLKLLMSQKKIYFASVLRLIVIPTFLVSILLLIGADKEIIKVTLCATAMPIGINSVLFPAAYGGDTTPGASMALVSHIPAIVTIPLMFLIFI